MAAIGALLQNLITGRLSLVLVVAVLVIGVLVGYLVERVSRRLLVAAGVDETVEGTAPERTAQRFGTSTVVLLSSLVALFVFSLWVVFALTVSAVLDAGFYLVQLLNYLPELFVAVVVVIVGLVVADRAKVLVLERFQDVKLPEVGLVSTFVKYSIVYVAALLALGQLGVANAALLVLLAAYAFGTVFLGGLACKDLLAASAAGFYLLLSEPYSIGDEVRINEMSGIVQEVDVFVTHIEDDGEEYIVPNHHVFRSGVVRTR
jgi:small-conductance mechanosensitive channel